MTPAAFDGRGLLLLAAIALIVIVLRVRRCARKIDRDIPAILDRPVPPERVIRRHAHALRRCTTCGGHQLVCIHEPDEILELMTDPHPTCGSCASILAALEQEIRS